MLNVYPNPPIQPSGPFGACPHCGRCSHCGHVPTSWPSVPQITWSIPTGNVNVSSECQPPK